MDVHQLELFLAVMDSPSMTRAAQKIHLSPGAVSLERSWSPLPRHCDLRNTPKKSSG
jgi:hypothetical protein